MHWSYISGIGALWSNKKALLRSKSLNVMAIDIQFDIANSCTLLTFACCQHFKRSKIFPTTRKASELSIDCAHNNRFNDTVGVANAWIYRNSTSIEGRFDTIQVILEMFLSSDMLNWITTSSTEIKHDFSDFLVYSDITFTEY